MDNGISLKADIFRPKDTTPAPVIMTPGPYSKGVPCETGFAPQCKWLIKTYPNILHGSTREFLVWETVDPEVWVPWGYFCIRVDSWGAGRSPVCLGIFSPRETKDYYNAIDWAGVQPWSNGKVAAFHITPRIGGLWLHSNHPVSQR